MAIHMTNYSVTYPRGVVEDLLVKIGNFVFPFDFVVLDMKEDEEVPIILVLPLLNTEKRHSRHCENKNDLMRRDKVLKFKP